MTTSRLQWTPPWSADRLGVEPLEDGDARSLIESIVEMRVADDLALAILARTGGNPFFIEEVVRELQGTGALVERNGVLAGSIRHRAEDPRDDPGGARGAPRPP